MRRTIILTLIGVKRLKKIRKTIFEGNDPMSDCPSWNNFVVDKGNSSCDICCKLFPKVNYQNCPCHIYSHKYLIRRLTEIIDYNEKNVEN